MEKYSFAAECINELQAEYEATKKCLERMRWELFDYKPHPKSMNMGYLALLVAEIPKWISYTIEKGDIDFVTFEHERPGSTASLVDIFERCYQGAINALQKADDETLETDFTLKANGKELFTTSKRESIAQDINHWVHHRGQFTVYLRMNNIDVPAIYGNSADEKKF
jgi:uncharacterized damage-inducible protein DinB